MQVCIPRRVPDCRPLSRPRSPSQTSGRVLCGEASRPVRNQEFGWTGQPGPCGDPPSQLSWTPEGSFVLQNFAVKQVVPGNTEPCLWRKGLFPGQVSGLGTEAAASGTWGLTDGSGERLHCWFEGLVSFRYKYKKSQKKRKLEEPFFPQAPVESAPGQDPGREAVLPLLVQSSSEPSFSWKPCPTQPRGWGWDSTAERRAWAHLRGSTSMPRARFTET